MRRALALGIAWSLVLLCSLRSVSASTIDFLAAPVYTTGDHYANRGVVVADFNHDGHADAAVVGVVGVQIMLGAGDGTLRPGPSFPSGDRPASFALGDFNGDSHADLVVANSGTSSDVTVALGNGDATFVFAPRVPVGTYPTGIVVADFNGDGHQDFATANAASATITVMSGVGDGSFTARTDYAVGVEPRVLVAVRLNADARPELAVINRRSTTLSVLLNAGDGTFAPAAHTGIAGEPTALVSADFDRDSRQDMVVSTRAGDVFLMRGNGDGTLQPAELLQTNGAAVVAADLTGDGIPDLATVSPDVWQVRILAGAGDGTFVVTGTYAVAVSGALAAGDFNQDGRHDLVASEWYSVAMIIGRGDGTFVAASWFVIGGGHGAARVADLNRDGIPDLVIGTSANLTVYLGEGGGRFRLPVVYPGRGAPALGDFNSDGNVDVALPCDTYLGTGTGALVSAPPRPCPTRIGAVTAADFNLDGRLDLISASPAGIAFVPGNGDGTFGTARGIAPTASYYIVSADFNADGRPDILIDDFDAGRKWLLILLGRGDGTFTYRSYVPGGYYSQPAVADFNADGVPDLALAHSSQNGGVTPSAVSIACGNGDGTFRLTYLVEPEANRGHPGFAAAADFDGDGRTDLAFSVDSGVLYVAPGNGDGTAGAATRYSIGSGELSTGDYDGDGKIDILAGQANHGLALVKNISR